MLCVDRPIFQRKCVLGGVGCHDPEQSKDLETRIKTPRGTPKNTIQCQNPPTGIPNFEWHVAAAELKPLAAARPRSAFESRVFVAFSRYFRALATCLPRQDHVHITTDDLFRFYNNEFDEMPCKLDSTENLRSFKQYP